MITEENFEVCVLSYFDRARKDRELLNKLTHLIHVMYYSKFPNDNRALDRTRDDYPLFLLEAIKNNAIWE